MKKQKLIIADLIAIIFTLITIYLPLFTNKITFLPMYFVYIFAYFAVIFSNQKDKKVLTFFIPLFTLSLILILLNKVDIYNLKIIKTQLTGIFRKNYSLILYIFALYFLERLSTKIFGSYFTIGLALVSLGIFLIIFNTKYLENLRKYKDYFFYVFIYFSFARIYPAKKINKYLYIIIILLFFLEVLVIDKYKIFIGFHISLILIIYLILKSNVYEINFEKYFLNGLIYLYPFINIILENILNFDSPIKEVATGLIVFFLTLIFYQIKLGFFDYVFLGIHKEKK